MLIMHRRAAFGAAFLALVTASTAFAQDEQEPWTFSAAYTADVIGVDARDRSLDWRALDNLDLVVDADLERLTGWRGARVHGAVLVNNGGEPNALAGTLQGIDNIEVGDAAVRLFELWIEQDLADGRATLRTGLYDLNSEFYATDAAGLLIAPPFGIGSELASTGPNGPSIFPSTALAARLRIGREEGGYGQVAAINARASTLGDPDGIDTDMDDGVLLIGEAGWNGPTRLAAGTWRYDRAQDDIRTLAPDGNPARTTAQGIYALAETDLFQTPAGGNARGFVRVGLSDGDTTDFSGGWQAGVLLNQVWASRPDSQFSIGVHEGLLSDKAQANLRDGGDRPASAEQGFEITYSDRIGPLTVQPDLQLIRNAGGLRSADTVVVVGLRVSVALD
ncbi:porin [Brevundimonas variabilis]|uniref:Porin n=2 Tax=Brevundimonas variabilis TaxID=74312 RepID=A0A7W9CFH1_9CAUL|nr:porin [Brevundimonas variabilis]